MGKIASIICRVLFAALLAVGVCGCTNLNSQSASAGSSQASAASASSAPADSASSSGASVSASAASASSGGYSVEVPANDDSYAQRHLVSETYTPPDISVKKKGEYSDKDHVALYIHLYGDVPSNYVTKTKARKAGWVNTEGNLWEVLPGKSIGGGGFYNDDNTMPDADGREWFECDIDYEGGFRNAKRLVYSNDGLIYYTGDHYKTFQRLY